MKNIIVLIVMAFLVVMASCSKVSNPLDPMVPVAKAVVTTNVFTEVLCTTNLFKKYPSYTGADGWNVSGTKKWTLYTSLTNFQRFSACALGTNICFTTNYFSSELEVVGNQNNVVFYVWDLVKYTKLTNVRVTFIKEVYTTNWQ
jgi:hypothetical protein